MPFKNQVDKLIKKASREVTYQSLADSIKVSRMHLWRLLNADSLTSELFLLPLLFIARE